MSRALAVAGAALVVTAAFAGWAGLRFASASAAVSNPASAAARARDAALAAGTREIADLNSVSVKNLPASQARWLADTAGGEHADIARTMGSAAVQIRKVKTTSAATVTDSALTALSVSSGGRPGSAGFIATVNVVSTNPSGGAATVRGRYTATLTLTPAGWKISSLKGG
jgi:Mce-associated membrane protein